jgi:hypothetical protein
MWSWIRIPVRMACCVFFVTAANLLNLAAPGLLRWAISRSNVMKNANKFDDGGKANLQGMVKFITSVNLIKLNWKTLTQRTKCVAYEGLKLVIE